MESDKEMGLQSDMTSSETASETGIWKIIVGVFMAPAEAFAAFNRKPTIVTVLILAIILGMVSGYFSAEYTSQMQFDMLSHSKTIPPQQLEQMRAQATDTNPLVSAVSGAAFQVIAMLIMALIAWAIGGFIMGGDSTFKRIWGVVLLASLIGLLGAVVKIPLMMAKGSMYVSIGLAALMPTKDFTSILYGFLFYFDAFMVWSMIVCGIGFSVIFNISRGKGLAVAIILDLIGFLLMFGLMYVGMTFAGVEITFF